jgi:pimeloyl-ACP methyl ester carboxylesterase
MSATLRDGRTLEYADLGDPSGAPVLFFHGTPSAAGQATVVADAARSRGVRLVAPTRPGYGASTLSPPGLSSTAADSLELADQLGLDRFALMGSSGGGPFALAVAAVAPDRVSAIAVHAGPGRYAEVKPEVLGDDDRRALALLADGDVDEAMRIMVALGDADLG